MAALRLVAILCCAPFLCYGFAQGCVTLPTVGGTQTPQPCAFPFRYQGTVYTACTSDQDPEGKLWCSVEVDSSGAHVSGKGKWGHCDLRACPPGDNINTSVEGTCGVTVNIAENVPRLAPGGENALPGSWPWMVAAGFYEASGYANKWHHQCGGSVVSAKHVLTAAHCAAAEGADRWLLLFGNVDTNSTWDDVEATSRTIEQTHIHPKWKSTESYYDVAVWRVRPLSFGRHVRPICLPDGPGPSSDVYVGRSAETMGWGVPGKDNFEVSNILRSTTLTVYSERFCNESFGKYPNVNIVAERYPALFTKGLICAGSPTGTKGTCYGDSGGPLAIEETHPRRRFVQIGIVQGGVGRCGSAHFPDAFARLEDPDIHAFIAEVTKTSDWSPWMDDGSCSTSCGKGVQRRTRACESGNCLGGAVSFVPCNGNKRCPDEMRPDPYGHLEIMVIAGYNVTQLSDVEIISLGHSEGRRRCRRFPEVRHAMVGQPSFPAQDEVTVCGGKRMTTPVKTCYVFGPNNNNAWREAPFRLNVERAYAASALLDDGTLAVFGGKDRDSNVLETTEAISRDGRAFQLGPDMPYPAKRHCILKVNSTHVFLAGGWRSSKVGSVSLAYLLDLEGSSRWNRLPDMAVRRSRHVCGLVNRVDIVVAGGWSSYGSNLDSAEVYSLETGAWRRGPDLPLRANGMAAVQLDATFLVTGGYAADLGYIDHIYQLDEESYSWIERPEKLGQNRGYHAAIALPNGSRFCE